MTAQISSAILEVLDGKCAMAVAKLVPATTGTQFYDALHEHLAYRSIRKISGYTTRYTKA